MEILCENCMTPNAPLFCLSYVNDETLVIWAGEYRLYSCFSQSILL